MQIYKEGGPDPSLYQGINEHFVLRYGTQSLYVSVYPSTTLEDQFTTIRPTVYTSLAVLIFFVTSMSFVLYDCYVERRHNVVNQAAIRNKTVVDMLFPEFVRDDVIEKNEKATTDETNETSTKNRKVSSAADTALAASTAVPIGKRWSTFMNNHNNNAQHDSSESGDEDESREMFGSKRKGKPMADLVRGGCCYFAFSRIFRSLAALAL